MNLPNMKKRILIKQNKLFNLKHNKNKKLSCQINKFKLQLILYTNQHNLTNKKITQLKSNKKTNRLKYKLNKNVN
jgi:hypothetical protein